MLKTIINYLKEKLHMINENTEVLIIGFPDPYDDDYNDYIHRCALKDSLWKMDKHLDKLNLDKRGRLAYQFSVLLEENNSFKLVYSYTGDREIIPRDEFKDILNFD